MLRSIPQRVLSNSRRCISRGAGATSSKAKSIRTHSAAHGRVPMKTQKETSSSLGKRVIKGTIISIIVFALPLELAGQGTAPCSPAGNRRLSRCAITVTQQKRDKQQKAQ